MFVSILLCLVTSPLPTTFSFYGAAQQLPAKKLRNWSWIIEMAQGRWQPCNRQKYNAQNYNGVGLWMNEQWISNESLPRSTQDGVVNEACKAEIKSHFPVIAPAIVGHWGASRRVFCCEALIKCKPKSVQAHTHTHRHHQYVGCQTRDMGKLKMSFALCLAVVCGPAEVITKII